MRLHDTINLRGKLTGAIVSIELLIAKISKSNPNKEWTEYAEQLGSVRTHLNFCIRLLCFFEDELNRLAKLTHLSRNNNKDEIIGKLTQYDFLKKENEELKSISMTVIEATTICSKNNTIVYPDRCKLGFKITIERDGDKTTFDKVILEKQVSRAMIKTYIELATNLNKLKTLQYEK